VLLMRVRRDPLESIRPPMQDRSGQPPRWRRYLRFWGSNVTADVDEEIAFHLDELTAHYVRCGRSPDTAKRIAAAQFGDVATLARSMRELAHEQESAMRHREWLDASRRDLRFAFRQLARRPGFTFIALVTLALGIGANTAIFSAVNAAVLHPIAAHQLGRLVIMRTNLPTINLMNFPLGPGEALDVIARRDLFDAAGAWRAYNPVLTGQGLPKRLAAVRTLGSFFDVFGVVPSLGRFYRANESERGQYRVVVLGYGLWQALGGDPAIVGKTVRLNDDAYDVVGVAPSTFDFPRGTDAYLPLPVDSATTSNRGQLVMNVVGRMRTGLTAEQFKAGIHGEQVRWHALPGSPYDRMKQFLTVTPLTTMLAGQLRPVLLVLFGAVAFVLIIACANVASLQLVHATARTREFAVRAALGAGRGAVIRQLLVENLVLSAGGGVLGVGLGKAMLLAVSRAGAASLPALQDVALDGTALAFAAGTTIFAALLFGIAPALRAGRVDLNDTLKESARGTSMGSRRNRLLQTGVVAQVALALILLLGSGLTIRSLTRLLEQNLGFNPEHVVTMRATTSGERYAAAPAISAFYDALISRVRALPGISAAGIVGVLPFSGEESSTTFTIRGRPADPTGPDLHANLNVVSDDYFAAMGIPLLRGRGFGSADRQGAPVAAIIDARLAQLFFPNENPIGQQIDMGTVATIVGIVGTVRQDDLAEPSKAAIYYSFRQGSWTPTYYIAVRTALPAATVAAMVRTAVSALDRNVPVYDIQTLDARIGRTVATRKLAMTTLTALAALSLLLSVFGLYGVISYAVSQRTAEFGIRAALGAQPYQVRGLVVRQGVALAATGIVLGLIGAMAATRALSAILFGVSVRDPATFAGAAILIGLIASVASYVPARRATRIDLVDALRSN
jgi:putative ABC transport system permease protein